VNSLPPFRALVGYFLRLGLTGFGGPVALANYMRRDLVERNGWIAAEEYDEGLAIATACPGPLAYQLGVYCGYVTHGVFGALAVAVAFAAAPFTIVVGIGALYVRFYLAAPSVVQRRRAGSHRHHRALVLGSR
jgi:chromate transporter